MCRRLPVLRLLLVVPVLLVGCGGPGDAAPAPRPDAASAARHFLDTYVEPDGRVVRPDQDGTTVSEGQAYALLLAQVAEDPDAFDRVWAWTQEELQRDDALLAYLADEDGVVDDTPASDADLIAAWALLREQDPARQADGRRLAGAVLAEEVVADPDPVLVAGPWAVPEQVVNPSYWTLPAYRLLDQVGSDPRWEQLRQRSTALLAELDGLPPDWGRLQDGRLVPTGRPDDPEADPAYGLDAQRTLVWLAVDCDPRARELAARAWPVLQDPERAGALALDLDGTVRDAARHPLPLVAAAAAARAAGDEAATARLLDEATAQDDRFPTYYGAAWVALGRALLQTDRLTAC